MRFIFSQFQGKTLTVIGLVLDAKYRKNLSIAEEDEDDTGSEDGDKDDDDDSDDENERGYKKSFASQGIIVVSSANDFV